MDTKGDASKKRAEDCQRRVVHLERELESLQDRVAQIASYNNNPHFTNQLKKIKDSMKVAARRSQLVLNGGRKKVRADNAASAQKSIEMAESLFQEVKESISEVEAPATTSANSTSS